MASRELLALLEQEVERHVADLPVQRGRIVRARLFAAAHELWAAGLLDAMPDVAPPAEFAGEATHR